MLDKLLPQILIVRHKESIHISLYNIIERAGFDIIKADTLEQAVSSNITPAIIIIDAQPPELQIIITSVRKIERLAKTPIIFLTAPEIKILDQSKGNFFSFLPKPFSSDQLINMIKDLLRRSKPILKDNVIKFKNISIDLNTQRLYKNDKIARLSRTEFKILYLFLQFPTTVFSRQKIMEYVWENHKDFNPRIIDVHINRIRQTLGGTDEEKDFIKTVRFAGYCLELPNT